MVFSFIQVVIGVFLQGGDVKEDFWPEVSTRRPEKRWVVCSGRRKLSRGTSAPAPTRNGMAPVLMGPMSCLYAGGHSGDTQTQGTP